MRDDSTDQAAAEVVRRIVERANGLPDKLAVRELRADVGAVLDHYQMPAGMSADVMDAAARLLRQAYRTNSKEMVTSKPTPAEKHADESLRRKGQRSREKHSRGERVTGSGCMFAIGVCVATAFASAIVREGLQQAEAHGVVRVVIMMIVWAPAAMVMSFYIPKGPVRFWRVLIAGVIGALAVVSLVAMLTGGW